MNFEIFKFKSVSSTNDVAIRKIRSGIKNGIYMYKGILTSQVLGETFDLPYKDIDLLMAAI